MLFKIISDRNFKIQKINQSQKSLVTIMKNTDEINITTINPINSCVLIS